MYIYACIIIVLLYSFLTHSQALMDNFPVSKPISLEIILLFFIISQQIW